MLKPTFAEFKTIIAQGVALIDFDVAWCAPCRVQKTIIDALARRFSGRVAVAVMDVDQNSRLANKMQIKSVPTLVLFKKGKEVSRLIGLQSEETLSKAMENALRE
ncbi:MAG: thioredoxin fold domain-containing protein [Desulfobacteraceae bacterium]|nr:thioredoxin fold domain-containing protein [Desulfobacteraceae bacterium]MBC2756080.1 thioredoxin fold domain-containing protein [Desulfobacteraceae bacterium]MBC2763762.1 thioredoxin fold domain-containing protein [ANME-2 cluster archaeon]